MLEEFRPPRRAVIVGAGLGALATAAVACSTRDDTPAAASSSSEAATTPGAAGTSAPDAGALTTTADVPVGSGVILGDVVVTQPTSGVFKGFSSVCPHAGCNVSKITDGKIVCPCHNSEFNLDGSVAQGPAKEPLTTKAISVRGDSIVAG